MRQVKRLGLALALLITPAARAQDRIVNVVMKPGPVRANQINPPRVVFRLSLESPGPSTASRDLDDDDGPREADPMVRVLPFNINAATLKRENFDRWLFGEGITEESRRDHLDRALTKLVEKAAGDHRLTDEQRAKVQLAGRGDIKHFLDRVGERRAEFEGPRKEFRAGLQFLQELEPIKEEYKRGPFDGESLFAKTLKKIEADRDVAR